MSYVITVPDTLAAAAADVAGIGSSLSEANSAAAAPTTAVVAAAEDEVSAAISALFSGYGKEFQALSAQAAAFHAKFEQALNGAGSAYAAAEATNASPLQAAAAALNAPAQVFGLPDLFGNGADGTASSPNGRDGGLIFGSGGAGYNSTTPGVAGGNGGNGGWIGNGGNGGTGGAGAAGGCWWVGVLVGRWR